MMPKVEEYANELIPLLKAKNIGSIAFVETRDERTQNFSQALFRRAQEE